MGVSIMVGFLITNLVSPLWGGVKDLERSDCAIADEVIDNVMSISMTVFIMSTT